MRESCPYCNASLRHRGPAPHRDCRSCGMTLEVRAAQAPARAPRTIASRRSRPALRLMAAALVGAGLVAAIAQRDGLARALPASGRLFALMGLSVQRTGLALVHVKGTITGEGVDRVLAVTGEIDNARDAARSIPVMRLALRGADGRDLYHWDADPPKTSLGAGQHVAFRSRLAAPPEGVHDIVVHFAPSAGAQGF